MRKRPEIIIPLAILGLLGGIQANEKLNESRTSKKIDEGIRLLADNETQKAITSCIQQAGEGNPIKVQKNRTFPTQPSKTSTPKPYELHDCKLPSGAIAIWGINKPQNECQKFETDGFVLLPTDDDTYVAYSPSISKSYGNPGLSHPARTSELQVVSMINTEDQTSIIATLHPLSLEQRKRLLNATEKEEITTAFKEHTAEGLKEKNWEAAVREYVDEMKIEYEELLKGRLNEEEIEQKKTLIEGPIRKKFQDQIIKFIKFVAKGEDITEEEIIESFLAVKETLTCRGGLKTSIKITPVDGWGKREKSELIVSVNNNINLTVKVWMHEFVHELSMRTMEGLGSYDTYAEQPYIEGVATLGATIVDPKENAKSNTQQYKNFATLTAARLGPERFRRMMIDPYYAQKMLNIKITDKNPHGGVTHISNSKETLHDPITDLMQRWEIDESYRDDLNIAFYHWAGIAKLTKTNLTEKEKSKYQGGTSADRLRLLKKILKENGISWIKFKRETFKDFGILPIKTSVD